MNIKNTFQVTINSSCADYFLYLHLAGSPPQISQSVPSPKAASPPHEPEIGFLPNITPIDIDKNINRRILNVRSAVLMFKF